MRTKKIVTISLLLLFIGATITPNSLGLFIENRTIHLNTEDQTTSDTLFDLRINLLMKLGHWPSLSACIIKNDSVVWTKGYGEYDIGSIRKASNDTIYLIGSCTKTFIATAVLQLYEQGIIDLDDNVSEWLPFDLKNPNYPEINITFRMLLAHQSSRFCTYNGPADMNLNIIKAAILIKNALTYCLNPPMDIHEWLMDYIAPDGDKYDPALWGNYTPGKYYNYSNDGFIILGYLIESITGQPFDEYCEQHIFTPLDMNNTNFHPADLDDDRLAAPYLWYGTYVQLPHYDMGALNPAGGIRSTIDDLSKYLIAHMNNGTYKNIRILQNETINLMHSVQYPNSNYGLGWIISNTTSGDVFEGHSGGNFGSITQMFALRNSSIGAIVFYNQNTPRALFKASMGPFEALALGALQNMLFNKGMSL